MISSTCRLDFDLDGVAEISAGASDPAQVLEQAAPGFSPLTCARDELIRWGMPGCPTETDCIDPRGLALAHPSPSVSAAHFPTLSAQVWRPARACVHACLCLLPPPSSSLQTPPRKTDARRKTLGKSPHPDLVLANFLVVDWLDLFIHRPTSTPPSPTKTLSILDSN